MLPEQSLWLRGPDRPGRDEKFQVIRQESWSRFEMNIIVVADCTSREARDAAFRLLATADDFRRNAEIKIERECTCHGYVIKAGKRCPSCGAPAPL